MTAAPPNLTLPTTTVTNPAEMHSTGYPPPLAPPCSSTSPSASPSYPPPLAPPCSSTSPSASPSYPPPLAPPCSSTSPSTSPFIYGLGRISPQTSQCSPTSFTSSDREVLSPASSSSAPSPSSPVGVSSSPVPLGPGGLSQLPPCKVCGGKSSGLHYCLMTCQGCRMFFRRMLKRSELPLCAKKNSCIIKASTLRTSCAACRYKKCIELGMRVTDKKVGRYSHAMRTTYTQEVQALQLNVQVSSHSQSLLSTSERDQQLDHMITHLTGVYLRFPQNRMEFLNTIPSKERRYEEEKRLSEQMFGTMKPLLDEEYFMIYQATGLDIDCRREMLKEILPGIERVYNNFLSFAWSIPGIKRLPVKDRIALLRGCMLKGCFMLGYHMYNQSIPAWTFLTENTMGMERMVAIHNEERVATLTRAVVAMQQLDLTPEEDACLYAYIILHADSDVSTEGRRIITHLQNTASDLLLRVIHQQHDQPDRFLARVVSAVVQMETASLCICEGVSRAVKNYSDLNWPFSTRLIFEPERVENLTELWCAMLKIT